MRPETNTETLLKLQDSFLEEYRSNASIRRYTKHTAGHGINYLLDEVYGNLYLDILQTYIPQSTLQRGLRILEFGCGGGMNILHLMSTLARKGFRVEFACGTDFSDELIAAANREAVEQLLPNQRQHVRFCIGKNEALVQDLSAAIGVSQANLLGTFDLIIGVNTIRYCHRMGTELDCARGIHGLLANSGVSIVIDMNRGFPLFRSRLRDRLTKKKQAYLLPSLDEYARPFTAVGLEILQKKNFCWVPHSAGPTLTSVLKGLTPVLNTLAPARAMRSLVIARKPV
jgi:SAM-dependent methyltransferase